MVNQYQKSIEYKSKGVSVGGTRAEKINTPDKLFYSERVYSVDSIQFVLIEKMGVAQNHL